MTIPVVFYYGEFDYMDTTAASYVCSKKPNCTFARIKRSTHHPNMVFYSTSLLLSSKIQENYVNTSLIQSKIHK